MKKNSPIKIQIKQKLIYQKLKNAINGKLK